MRRRVRFIAVFATVALLAQPGVTAAAGDGTVTLLVAARPGTSDLDFAPFTMTASIPVP